jgi:hypothetical protein
VPKDPKVDTWSPEPRIANPGATLDDLVAEGRILIHELFITAEKLPNWGVVLRRIRLAACRDKLDAWLDDLTSVAKR